MREPLRLRDLLVFLANFHQALWCFHIFHVFLSLFIKFELAEPPFPCGAPRLKQSLGSEIHSPLSLVRSDCLLCPSGHARCSVSVLCASQPSLPPPFPASFPPPRLYFCLCPLPVFLPTSGSQPLLQAGHTTEICCVCVSCVGQLCSGPIKNLHLNSHTGLICLLQSFPLFPSRVPQEEKVMEMKIQARVSWPKPDQQRAGYWAAWFV